MWRWQEESVDGEPVRVMLIYTGCVRGILAMMGAWLSCMVVLGDRCCVTDSVNTGTLSHWLGWRAAWSLMKMSWLSTLAFVFLRACCSCTAWPWICRHYSFSKCHELLLYWHTVVPQKIIIFNNNTARTSGFTLCRVFDKVLGNRHPLMYYCMIFFRPSRTVPL